MYCNTYKNKSSEQRCENKALTGSQFCGKHIRLKSPRLWINLSTIIKIQKTWRGYLIRNILKILRGDMKKHTYANSEDLYTFEDSHILDKFEFVENGKIWWFDVCTIHEWSCKLLEPTNPYTKTLLTIEDRKRLKDIVGIRRIRNVHTIHDNKQLTTVEKFTVICQILEENGLEANPNTFLNLTSFQITVFLNFLEHDLRTWHSESPCDLRKGFHFIVYQFLSQQFILPLETHSRILANSILYMFRQLKNPYNICFMVTSALYRS